MPSPLDEDLGSGDSSFAAKNDGDGSDGGGGAGGTVAAVVIVLIVLCVGAVALYVRRTRSRNARAAGGDVQMTATPSAMRTYVTAPLPADGRARSASRSRSRAGSVREAKGGAGANLYGPLELAKDAPLTYGPGSSTYGNLAVGPAPPTYAVASSYGTASSAADGLYAPAESRYGTVAVGPAVPGASRDGTYETASAVAGGRYGTVTVAPAAGQYETASSVATNAMYTAPLPSAQYTAPEIERGDGAYRSIGPKGTYGRT